MKRALAAGIFLGIFFAASAQIVVFTCTFTPGTNIVACSFPGPLDISPGGTPLAIVGNWTPTSDPCPTLTASTSCLFLNALGHLAVKNPTGQITDVQTGTTTVTTVPVDLALGKTASQSSTAFPQCGPQNAVDGNTDGNFADNSITHTNDEANAWWEVDLGSSQNVNSIVIWNRTDCCGDRLSDYWVFISSTAFQPTDTPTTLAANPLIWNNHQTVQPNPSTTIPVGGVHGEFIRVQLTGTNYLSLAEVQVY